MGTIEQFKTYLIQEEKSPLTVEKYLRDVRFFLKWLNGRMIIKAEVLSYKEALMESYAVASVNSMLSSLNCYLNFIGRADCQVKTIKQQRRTFCAAEKELTKQEIRHWNRLATTYPQWLKLQKYYRIHRNISAIISMQKM